MKSKEATMTLDEAIKRFMEAVEECQSVVDTGIVFDDVTIDMLYCDDTEFIEECLANYQRSANENRQVAEWLKDYKRLLDQKPILGKIRAEIEQIADEELEHDEKWAIGLRYAVKIIDKYTAENEDKQCLEKK